MSARAFRLCIMRTYFSEASLSPVRNSTCFFFRRSSATCLCGILSHPAVPNFMVSCQSTFASSALRGHPNSSANERFCVFRVLLVRPTCYYIVLSCTLSCSVRFLWRSPRCVVPPMCCAFFSDAMCVPPPLRCPNLSRLVLCRILVCSRPVCCLGVVQPIGQETHLPV